VNPKDFEAKYTVGKKLGEGAHGYVKECFHRETGNIYALKTINTDN
jgi:serine/threonine protein kinase